MIPYTDCTLPRHPARRVALLAGWLLLAACAGGDGAAADVADACAEPTANAVLAAAVENYLNGREPRPLRFLNAAGTDSAMPSQGMAVLQRRGPTYIFPPDSAGREVVRTRLQESPWPSLLVTFHGIERTSSEGAVVRLHGTWVSGELDGQPAGVEEVRFLCRDGRWTPADSVVPAATESLPPRPRA